MAKNKATGQIWLVLLPRLPANISLSTLKAAYGPGLQEGLQIAAKASRGALNVVMDIAIACDDRLALDYSSLQKLLGLMYRYICVICTQYQIDIQYGNEVDTRLVLFRDTQYRHVASAKSPHTLIDLEDLAKTGREWQRILSLEGGNAEYLLQDFIQFRNQSSQHAVEEAQLGRLPGGLTVHHIPPQDVPAQGKVFQRHKSVAVGGTFDHLHAGHKLLLTMTALVLDLEASGGTGITVGITGDELLKKKQFREELEDFFERQSAVKYFLLGILELMSPAHVLKSSQHFTSPASFGREVHDSLKSGLIIKYVEIFDPCGPTVTDEAISALVLSAETRSGGQIVNDKREDKGWPALEIFEVDVLDAAGDETSQSDEGFQGKISSTDIRRRVHQMSSPANGRS